MEPGHFHSCDYELTCWDCLTEHPGNWYVVLEDDWSSCCVPSPSDVKYPRLLDVNTTDRCPETLIVKTASYGLGALSVVVCLVGVIMMGRWIYRRWCSRKGNQSQEAVDMEMDQFERPDAHGPSCAAGEFLVGEEREQEGSELSEGYTADDEASTPGDSQDNALNMMTYEGDDMFNLEGGGFDIEMETTV